MMLTERMTEQLKDMGARLSMLRESTGYTPEKIAEALELPLADYLQYEAGKRIFRLVFFITWPESWA
jgi:transcriptional regulator with XRE-family HTH domain